MPWIRCALLDLQIQILTSKLQYAQFHHQSKYVCHLRKMHNNYDHVDCLTAPTDSQSQHFMRILI